MKNNKLQIIKPQTQELAVMLQDKIVSLQPADVMLRLSKCNSIELAANSNEISLRALKKEKNSKEFVINYICIWIAEFQEFTNVKTKMTKAQMVMTAMDIYDLYSYMKLSDINLIFKKARTGEFGSLYESLDGIKILSWFRNYEFKKNSHYEDCLDSASSFHIVENSNRSCQSTSISDHKKEIDFFKYKYKNK